MKSKKCALCAQDEAASSGVLCTACREAIARLLAIREQEFRQLGEQEQLEEVVVYSERRKNTRQAGS